MRIFPIRRTRRLLELPHIVRPTTSVGHHGVLRALFEKSPIEHMYHGIDRGCIEAHFYAYFFVYAHCPPAQPPPLCVPACSRTRPRLRPARPPVQRALKPLSKAARPHTSVRAPVSINIYGGGHTVRSCLRIVVHVKPLYRKTEYGVRHAAGHARVRSAALPRTKERN